MSFVTVGKKAKVWDQKTVFDKTLNRFSIKWYEFFLKMKTFTGNLLTHRNLIIAYS